MRDFYRSLRYLKPYKARLVLSCICVLLIAVLWGGGLGMLIPAMKILIDREGFHGWAWRSASEDRLGVILAQRDAPAKLEVDGRTLAIVVDVIDVSKDSPAARAGIKKGNWLIGTKQDAMMRGDELARMLARARAGDTVELLVYDQYAAERPTSVATVQLRDLTWKSGALVRIASHIKEPESFRGRFDLLIWVLAIGAAATVLRDLLRFCQDYLIQTATWRAMLDIRCQNYNVALRLPVTFYSSKGATDTMSRFIQDTHSVRRGQVALFGKTIVEPAKAVVALVVAMAISWKFTLVATLAGPVIVFMIYRFGRVMKRASRRALENWSKMLAILEETLTGIRVVKAYTMEAAERKRFFRVNRKLLKEQDRMSRTDAATPPTVEAMALLVGMAAAGTAGYFVFSGVMKATDFLGWLMMLAAMFDPVRKLSGVGNRFQQADAAAKRLFELHDQPQEKRVTSAPSLAPHCRDIELRNVYYRYPEAAADALKDVNLSIKAGETVAIVGPNGSGKTTLVSLLPRLLDPTAGEVLIDGQDISKVSLRSLRRQISVVTQEAVLFNATIAENISYGLRRTNRDAVLAAAKKAFVDEFVSELPEGYETMVGEHGATLSGGQKQRITIARAIIRNPRILIFDEAMSQIDADSECKIHQAMEDFVTGRTTLMIAHRFATVLSADRIFVLDAGRIIDTGTHDELLERCDVYRHLYKTQFAATGGQ